MVENLKLCYRVEHRLVVFLVALFVLLPGVVSSSYDYYRLPTSLLPEQYQLKIITHLDDPETFNYDGEVSIRFKALEDTNNITLHAQWLTIDESRIELKSYEDDEFRFCLEGIEDVLEQDYYIIRLCQPLRKGQIYKVVLYYSPILPAGYMRSSYMDKATNETKFVSFTHFEPFGARTVFPCFDEPDLKARFVIWLGHHKSLTALSNMPREKQIPMDDVEDFVWTIFEESVPMSTYLVAFAVNEFVYKESQIEGHDVVFRTWCRRGVIDQCEYATEIALKLLNYFADVFATPFPLQKLDQIAIPNFGSAMENWGLIIYEEKMLLYTPNVSTEVDKKDTTKVVAHEVAHQWFGNLVTMKWWADLWLNEGFTTYVANLGVQHLIPEWEIYSTESLLNTMSVFQYDDKLSSHPVSQPAAINNKVQVSFDMITYLKGSEILRMMHTFLGQDEFFEGVRNYLTKYKYRNAEQDDLWAELSEIAHKHNRIQPQHDIKTIMDSWTRQTGYPVVTVSRNYATGSIEISQHRFLKNSTISPDEDNKCWWVPLSYTSATELDFAITTPKAWLDCDESGKSLNLKLDNVTGANEWIIFNIQLSGVYRVMYDLTNWQLLQKTLTSDSFTNIHVMNRAQIVGDVLSFAWSKYLNYELALDIVEYLMKEREYLPWQSALVEFTGVFDILKYFPQHLPYFKAYMRYLIEPIYSHVDGLNATIEASMLPSRISLQRLVSEWACRVDLDNCIQTAIDYFQQWKSMESPDEENMIPVDLRTIVYCTAIRHGDNEDWTFLWQRFMASEIHFDKMTIIRSLGCLRNATAISDLIDMIFDTDNDKMESVELFAFGEIASSDIGFPLALEYFTEYISELHNDQFNMISLLESLFNGIVSSVDQNKLTSLVESNPEYFNETRSSFSHAFETSNLNLQFIEHNLEDLITQIQSRLSIVGNPKDNVIES